MSHPYSYFCKICIFRYIKTTKKDRSEPDPDATLHTPQLPTSHASTSEDQNIETTESDYSSSKEKKSEKKKKTIRKRKYVQKYSSHWETEFKWCQKSLNSNFPYCRVCNKEIKGNRAHLERHERNALHKKQVLSKSKVVAVDNLLQKSLVKNANAIKVGELKLAAFVAEHDLSFNVMEHLPKLLRSICKDSEIATGVKCSRTKTTEIITNTIGPYVLNNIVKDLNKTFYSVIIDETTDISTKKCLAVLVRYFKNNAVVDSFLGLLELENGSTAANIFNCLINHLISAGIKIENMAGFAADNCATMMGQLNGVQALLKNRLPHLVVVGCSSHSFNLCSSYACAKIPKSVEDLVKDIYAHFAHSSKRINTLQEFQTFCELKPHKILRPSETRWLSLQHVVDRVLEQYEALILYFTNSAFEEGSDKIDTILSALNNKINKMYLQFLSYTLKLVNTINIEFQSEKPRLHQLLPRVSSTYRQILKNYLKIDYVNRTELSKISVRNPENFVALENVYFGFKVQETISNNTQLHPKHLHDFRINCLNFYIELAVQVKNRFPFGNELYTQLTWLDPQNIFSDNKASSIIPLVRKFPNMVNENILESINTEWRSLSELPVNKFNKDMELEELVTELGSCKNGFGEYIFPNLYTYLKNILSLPHGSASAERIFSSLNIIKRKNRNCLNISTCHNLLLTKEMMRGTTCCEWEPPTDIITQMRKT